MLLEPTEDIVFFPALLTLAPREERKVRVGLATSPGPSEKTYRIFVEELPPVEVEKLAAGVTMRTKMGIPIFVQPSVTTARAQLGKGSFAGDRVSFSLQNTGTVHFTPDAIRVRGLDGTGAVVADVRADAWYVLAGGRRDFEVALPAARCAEIRSLTVEVQVLTRALRESMQTPSGACGKQQ
jgi:fimbrial chaperone protein